MRRNFGCFKSENKKMEGAFREVYNSESPPKFNTRISIAGDAGNTPKMKTMQGADAASAFLPGILYPYHSGKTDTAALQSLVEDQKGIVVRIKRMP